MAVLRSCAYTSDPAYAQAHITGVFYLLDLGTRGVPADLSAVSIWGQLRVGFAAHLLRAVRPTGDECLAALLDEA
jgi:hypothetical protein